MGVETRTVMTDEHGNFSVYYDNRWKISVILYYDGKRWDHNKVYLSDSLQNDKSVMATAIYDRKKGLIGWEGASWDGNRSHPTRYWPNYNGTAEKELPDYVMMEFFLQLFSEVE